MPNVLLPILPGTLPEGVCFQNDQERLNAFAAVMQAVLSGMAFYNYGDTKPSVANQQYPWLRSLDMRWYRFDGVWKSPNNYNPSERRLWIGSEADLVTYDGGSSGSVTPVSGPMWQIDSNFTGRVPMGPGVIPNSNPSKTLAVVEQYGDGSHTLTEAEGAVGQHTHATGKYLSGAAGLSGTGGNFTVPTYSGFVVQGINGAVSGADTIVNLFTLPAGSNAGGVTSTPFSIVPPVVGCYIIKPSGRLFFTVP